MIIVRVRRGAGETHAAFFDTAMKKCDHCGDLLGSCLVSDSILAHYDSTKRAVPDHKPGVNRKVSFKTIQP